MSLFYRLPHPRPYRHTKPDGPLQVSHAGSSSMYILTGSGFASTPDTTAISVTGDLEVRFDGALADWSHGPASFLYLLIGHGDTAFTNFAWHLFVNNEAAGSRIRLDIKTGADVDLFYTSNSLAWVDGQRHQIRVTLDLDNGANSVATFYRRSPMADLADNAGWTNVGSSTHSVVASIKDVAETVKTMGADVGPSVLSATGQMHRSLIYNGIGGTIVSDLNFTHPEFVVTPGDESVWDDQAGANVWTMSGTEFVDWRYDVEARIIAVAKAGVIYTGFSPTVSGSGTVIAVGKAGATYTGRVPILRTGINPAKASPVYTAYAPTLNRGVNVGTANAIYTRRPVTLNTSIAVGKASATYTGYVPLPTGLVTTLAVGKAGAIYTGYAPNAVVAQTLVPVPAAHATYTGHMPSVSGITATLPIGKAPAVVYTGYAPGINLTTITVGKASVLYTGRQPALVFVEFVPATAGDTDLIGIFDPDTDLVGEGQ